MSVKIDKDGDGIVISASFRHSIELNKDETQTLINWAKNAELSQDTLEPATCTKEGERYVVRLYGTPIIRSMHLVSMETMASDINTAIKRHKADSLRIA